MDSKNRIDLAIARLEQAKDCLKMARISINEDSFKTSANRSYYAIFHSIRALLALIGFDSKKHSGIISKFSQIYIKTGKFDAIFLIIVRDAFEARNLSDYEDFYVVSKTDVTKQLENAKLMFTAAENYINKHLKDIQNGD